MGWKFGSYWVFTYNFFPFISFSGFSSSYETLLLDKSKKTIDFGKLKTMGTGMILGFESSLF